jgi:hypothetical protein
VREEKRTRIYTEVVEKEITEKEKSRFLATLGMTRGGLLRTSRHRLWIAGVACVAIATAVFWRFYVPRQNLDERAVAAAQDEVYAVVVRDMTTPADGRVRMTQLVFSDELLSERKGTDTEACKKEVRSRQRWVVDAPPYDTLVDKAYRFMTRGRFNSSVRTETVEDFLEKSCSTGYLSRTFQTDLPRSFVASENVLFEGWPIVRNGPPSFEKLFPGANGVISLSRVGFDSGLDEAMVSASFACGGLCGEGWHYILRKRGGKWEVAGKRMGWVS